MIDMHEFQMRARIETETLQAWIEASWLVPRRTSARTEAAPSFTEADLARAELIRDLKDDLGVNDDGVAVILNLVDQIHGLRRTLGDLLQAVRAQPESVQRQVAARLRQVEPPSGG
jgi:chaperone modulatory protein CbpM